MNSETNLNEYTKPTYLCESDSPLVKEKARTLLKNGTKKQKVKKLFKWVRDTYAWDMRKVVGAEKLLKSDKKLAMSFDKTNLFVGLCRSLNIPTRYLYLKCDFKNKLKEEPDTSIHIPAEVYLNGRWIVSDPSFGIHSKKYMPISKFGEKTWIKVYEKKKMKSLSRKFIFFFNYFALYLHPLIRRIKKELKETRIKV